MAHSAGARRLDLSTAGTHWPCTTAISASRSPPRPVGGHVSPEAIHARLVAALDVLSEGDELDECELSQLLNDGCSRAHELEMRFLHLQRRSQAAINGHGDLDAFASIRREQRAVSRELDVLRGRLALLRGAGRQSQVL
jgi:hypothetical protein